MPSYTEPVKELKVQLDEELALKLMKSGPTPCMQLLSWLKVPMHPTSEPAAMDRMPSVYTAPPGGT